MDFDDFARAELPGLLAFATVLCVDRGLAEDVVQEVLLRCQSQWGRVGATEHTAAYVRRMIVNEFLSWRRKWARIVTVADPAFVLATPDYAIAHAERDQLVRELVRLPRRQRAVLVRYYLDSTDAEIAETLGCSQSTVRSHASRGLAALRVEIVEPSTIREVR